MNCHICNASSVIGCDHYTHDTPDTELQALQNAANKIPGLVVYEFINPDKRVKTKKYYCLLFGTHISPTVDYDRLNHFILGFIKAKQTT